MMIGSMAIENVAFWTGNIQLQEQELEGQHF